MYLNLCRKLDIGESVLLSPKNWTRQKLSKCDLSNGVIVEMVNYFGAFDNKMTMLSDCVFSLFQVPLLPLLDHQGTTSSYYNYKFTTQCHPAKGSCEATCRHCCDTSTRSPWDYIIILQLHIHHTGICFFSSVKILT